MPARKIIDRINETLEEGGIVTSFEFFPAKTEAGVDNLLARVEGMAARLRPTYVTLTWRSAFKDESLWLKIGSTIQREFGVDVLLHLTCHLPVSDLKRVLRNVREAGIRNILALRGDPPIGEDSWRPVEGGLSNAVELVRLIREEHGDYFCVAVAAYPETHTECWNDPKLPPSEQAREMDLERFRAKCDAGADFAITQFFYDVGQFLVFAKRCEEKGIKTPVVPGYMPIQTYRGFVKFSKWCRTFVPPEVMEDLDEIKDDDAAVKDYGVGLAVRTFRILLAHGFRMLHFYTMNLEGSVSRVLDELGLRPKLHERDRPWADTGRAGEDVRPIFWANRALSYLSRTSAWDEFPNGRWGDFRSPAYGELTDYYLAFKRPKVDRKKLWGLPKSEQDVWNTFCKFLRGKVSSLPWCDSSPAPETNSILDDLLFLNQHGFLTINSQPRINGVPSDDTRYGWGGPGGIVFQKAYVECFVRESMWEQLREALSKSDRYTFHAIHFDGKEETNLPEERATAVTWGVFPGREVLQPTIVDPQSFRAWKEEAFALWKTQWAKAYEKKKSGEIEGRDGVWHGTEEEKVAWEVVEGIRTSYVLVNVVDNGYAEEDSDVFTPFRDAVAANMTLDELRSSVHELQAELVRSRRIAREAQYRAESLQNEVDAARVRADAAEREAEALRARVGRRTLPAFSPDVSSEPIRNTRGDKPEKSVEPAPSTGVEDGSLQISKKLAKSAGLSSSDLRRLGLTATTQY